MPGTPPAASAPAGRRRRRLAGRPSPKALPGLLLLAASRGVAATGPRAPAAAVVEDRSPLCGEWAAQGECANSPGMMRQKCAASCALSSEWRPDAVTGAAPAPPSADDGLRTHGGRADGADGFQAGAAKPKRSPSKSARSDALEEQLAECRLNLDREVTKARAAGFDELQAAHKGDIAQARRLLQREHKREMEQIAQSHQKLVGKMKNEIESLHTELAKHEKVIETLGFKTRDLGAKNLKAGRTIEALQRELAGTGKLCREVDQQLSIEINASRAREFELLDALAGAMARASLSRHRELRAFQRCRPCAHKTDDPEDVDAPDEAPAEPESATESPVSPQAAACSSGDDAPTSSGAAVCSAGETRTRTASIPVLGGASQGHVPALYMASQRGAQAIVQTAPGALPKPTEALLSLLPSRDVGVLSAVASLRSSSPGDACEEEPGAAVWLAAFCWVALWRCLWVWAFLRLPIWGLAAAWRLAAQARRRGDPPLSGQLAQEEPSMPNAAFFDADVGAEQPAASPGSCWDQAPSPRDAPGGSFGGERS